VKVAIECRSVLLQKALQRFLGKHIGLSKNSDIIIRDYKSDDPKSFYIATDETADLVKPFSRSQLLLALENRYNQLDKNSVKKRTKKQNSANFEILQKRIEMLTEEYKNNILEAIKAFYG